MYQRPPSFQPPLWRSASFNPPYDRRQSMRTGEVRRGARRFLRALPGSKGELTSPAYERSQRAGEGGPRQHPLSLVDGGGRIDARPEKAVRAIERAPRVGSTDAPPWSALRGPESTQHARDRRFRSATSPAAARQTSRPGVDRAPRGRPLAGRKIPPRACVCHGMPASGWIRDRPGCRRARRGAVPARRRRTASG
jgi:hypothetical protein